MSKTWLKDDNGNECSVEYFGSEDAARKALASLIDCRNCSNCSCCSRCSDCSDCSHCSNCSGCSDCSDCSHCSDCSRCSYCSYCSDCSRCSGCLVENDKTGEFVPPTVPKIDDIHKRVYEAASAPDALDMADWHTCDTTHCRAGWVVHLAGDAGYELERFHNTTLAAQLIYRESGYEISLARFYDSNDEALADMKRLAETEAVD